MEKNHSTTRKTGMFDRYREALDEAVKLATKHNIEPINGATAVFVNVSDAMVRARLGRYVRY